MRLLSRDIKSRDIKLHISVCPSTHSLLHNNVFKRRSLESRSRRPRLFYTKKDGVQCLFRSPRGPLCALTIVSEQSTRDPPCTLSLISVLLPRRSRLAIGALHFRCFLYADRATRHAEVIQIDMTSGVWMETRLYTFIGRRRSLLRRDLLCSLLHLETKEARLGTADDLGIVAIFEVESVAAIIQRVDLLSTSFFLVVILDQAI